MSYLYYRNVSISCFIYISLHFTARTKREEEEVDAVEHFIEIR